MDAEASSRRGGPRKRTSSLFDPHGSYISIRKEHDIPSLRGTFSVSHCETPENSVLDDIDEEKLPKKHGEKRLQNTFQLDPVNVFNASKVEAILESELKYLEDVDYEPDTARKIVVELANTIKSKVKPLFPRYKTVVQVTIGGKGSQGVKVASKCFWDKERDNYASYTVTSATLFAVATVYGLYYE
eukprot:Seg1814.9 transcript_id=Seg1814.9/GoldUCD/mRNA.D3Y31 product="Tctex1 domain-containing protein 1-A" protein_id=Seg1814.9/GoldUCD/D3Y31